MNSHLAIQKRLAAYCGGDLDPAEREQVELHLADCPDCRAGQADLQTALRLLRSTPEVEPPPWLTGRVMANIREQQALKRSWLQRLFLPLHIKLPLEVIALLTICVSGYYLTRTVETELNQPPGRQLLELPPPSPARDETGQVPAAEKKQADSPVRGIPEKKDLPGVMPPQAQFPPAPPVYAPAPPLVPERSAGKAETLKSLPSAESFDRVQEASPERRAKSSRRLEQAGDAPAPAAADRVTAAPAGLALPQVLVRLSVTDPAAAPALVREAVLRSGGTVVNEQDAPGQRLRIHLPAARQHELLERLERLGRISERPAPSYGSAGSVDMTILW
jgi:hypothetical protein